MKARLLIYLFAFIFIVFAVGIFYIIKNKETQTQEVSTDQKNEYAKGLPPLESGQQTSEKKFEIDTPSGELSVNNFQKGAEIAGSGVIYFVDKEQYNINYNSTSNEFIVTLLVGSDVERVRKEAENELLAKLGVPQSDACKLKVFLYVSAGVTTDTSLSQNHGLSFCPGSKPFPN